MLRLHWITLTFLFSIGIAVLLMQRIDGAISAYTQTTSYGWPIEWIYRTGTVSGDELVARVDMRSAFV